MINNKLISAFPINGETEDPGMTLRDWFAGRAMQAFITNIPHGVTYDINVVAEEAYMLADAMIRVGEVQP